MAKKFLSVIIVPHTKTSTRTFCFSQRMLRVLAGGGAVFALALIVFLVDYVSMSTLRQRYKALTREAAEQKVKIADYEKSIGELQAAVSNSETLTKKINILLGLKSPEVLKSPAGVGGGGPDADAADAGVVPPGSPQGIPQDSMQGLIQRAQNAENNLSITVNAGENRLVELAMTPSKLPTAGWVSSPFGMRTDPFTGDVVMHWGVDISTNEGNPVKATADGIVIKVQKDKYLGNSVTISHANGISTVYGHMMDMKTRVVHEGQSVKRGDIIGYVGHTGKALGPHVHYEVHRDGKPVNPYPYILEE
ncbi:MAG TPA: M23 family metallopeptidase [Burkholderiales bacterium]|nr:M23 family metallopeptidase [Burkholderiales bacterium]